MSVVGGQPKKHANPSYKATKHIERTFLFPDYYQLYGLLKTSSVNAFERWSGPASPYKQPRNRSTTETFDFSLKYLKRKRQNF